MDAVAQCHITLDHDHILLGDEGDIQEDHPRPRSRALSSMQARRGRCRRRREQTRPFNRNQKSSHQTNPHASQGAPRLVSFDLYRTGVWHYLWLLVCSPFRSEKAITDALQHRRSLHIRHTVRLQCTSNRSCVPRPQCRIHRCGMWCRHSSSLQTSTPAEDDRSEAEAVATSTGSPAPPWKDWESGDSHFVIRPWLDGACKGALDGACGGAGRVWVRIYPCFCKSSMPWLVGLARHTRLIRLATA